MKIAHISQSYPPMVSGAALVVEHLVEGMANRGHSLLVCAASWQKMSGYEIKSQIQYCWLTSYKNPNRAHQRFSLWPKAQLDFALNSFQPDIIHLHEPLILGVAATQYAKQMQVPVIITIHQLPWLTAFYGPSSKLIQNMIEQLLWKYSRWFLKRCDVLVAPSNYVGQLIQNKTDLPVQVISNGLDLNLFKCEPLPKDVFVKLLAIFDLDAGIPVILHVGRLDPEKKVDILIRAAAFMQQTHKIQLLIVGDGTERGKLQRLCKQLEVKATFTGFVARNRLPEIYRLGTVFGTASEIETQGLVVLEAVACGTPVVAVNASCMAEIIAHGENGFLVDPGDYQAMARKLNQAINETSFKVRPLENTKYVAHHALSRSLDEYENFYLRLIDRAGIKLTQRTDIEIRNFRPAN